MLGVDLAAEIPQPSHEVANGLGLVATGDMLGAEVAVRHAVAQHAVAAHRRHDAVLLYVEARAPWMRDFHRVHPCGATRGPPRRSLLVVLRGRAAHGHTVDLRRGKELTSHG